MRVGYGNAAQKTRRETIKPNIKGELRSTSWRRQDFRVFLTNEFDLIWLDLMCPGSLMCLFRFYWLLFLLLFYCYWFYCGNTLRSSQAEKRFIKKRIRNHYVILTSLVLHEVKSVVSKSLCWLSAQKINQSFFFCSVLKKHFSLVWIHTFKLLDVFSCYSCINA